MKSEAPSATVVLARAAKPARRGWLENLQSVNYAVLLAISFVVFQMSAMYRTSQGFDAETGDPFRRIATLTMFVLVCAVYALQPRWQLSRILPASLAVFLGWVALSVTWAINPDISLRRAAFSIMIIIAQFICIRQIGSGRAYRVMMAVLCAVVAADLAAVAYSPQAIHRASEYGSSLAGDWRGLQSHKNSAGAIAGTLLIVALGAAIHRRSLHYLAWTGAALALLIGSMSKTSIILAPVAIAVGLAVANAPPQSLTRRVGAIAALSLVAGAVVLLVFSDERVWVEFFDPDNFTGRMEVWHLLVRYSAEHIWLGSGYGSFWQVGSDSPVAGLAEGWAGSASSGHNGYLDLLAETGIVGLALGLYAFGVAVVVAFLRNSHLSKEMKYVAVSLLSYFMLRNLLETGILVDHQTPIWVMAAAICANEAGQAAQQE